MRGPDSAGRKATKRSMAFSFQLLRGRHVLVAGTTRSAIRTRCSIFGNTSSHTGVRLSLFRPQQDRLTEPHRLRVSTCSLQHSRRRSLQDPTQREQLFPGHILLHHMHLLNHLSCVSGMVASIESRRYRPGAVLRQSCEWSLFTERWLD